MRTVASGVAAACLMTWAGSACAQDLVYQPINPSFGGNPFNSAHLLGVAGAINDYKDPSAKTSTGSSQSDLFARQLQSRLLSALSSQITGAIFGENPQETGNVNFGGQQISWVRTLEAVTVTIVDDATGAETVIEVPTFIEVN
ncbi:MAG: curli assembly protein CsgF [Phenylobacterium sp.]|uniref:curli assembly protein CsgF n=1 Tax=Phenylobacterium sp. TaxID=1871053 RepID=UPI002A2CCFEF|nr:curli assembly protein CsgF [Phenylobacterium sp.]MDD3838118.1 curli assembly protein CsgF [Phenylobacterium sp.]MDX9997851.1 curli assembly protein CsgF [Phenylobacterium sp.]